MKKVLVTGATGYVGGMVSNGLAAEFEVVGVSAHGDPARGVGRCDLTSVEACRGLADEVAPDVVIHAAGYKDVKGCENDPAKAFALNGEATINVAKVFGDAATVIYIGTDYVFPGDVGRYGENAPLAPVTYYGRSKLCGEISGLCLSERFVALRVAAIYDRRATFIRYLEGTVAAGGTAECFVDAFYSPTYRGDFIAALRMLAEAEHPPAERVLHINGERISRYDFARLWAEAFGYPVERILPAHRGADMPFLFADISLDNRLTRSVLGCETTGHREALIELAREEAG